MGFTEGLGRRRFADHFVVEQVADADLDLIVRLVVQTDGVDLPQAAAQKFDRQGLGPPGGHRFDYRPTLVRLARRWSQADPGGVTNQPRKKRAINAARHTQKPAIKGKKSRNGAGNSLGDR